MGGLVRAVLRARADTRDGDPEAMHRLRIAIKRYRYALEALTEAGASGLQPAIQAARSLQSDLGSLHDLDVLIEVVRRNAHLPGAGGFLRHLLRRRLRQAEKSLRRLAGFRPVFAAPSWSGDRPGRVAARRGSPPRQAQTGWTAA
jgi:CHAD domain-containing protein